MNQPPLKMTTGESSESREKLDLGRGILPLDPKRVVQRVHKFDQPQLDKLFNTLPEQHQKQTTRRVLQIIFSRREITDYQIRVITRGKAQYLLMKNYLILDKIGKGAHGTVFRAVHLSMQREVALKVLSSKHVKNTKIVQRFFREIRTAGRLQHPNIVAGFDSNQAHGHWFLISEYVKGQNLDASINDYGPASIPLAIDIILQAAQGLSFAHESGIIHRDIKPSNLIRNEVGEVKILDLGLVRLEAEQDLIKLTRSGLITGTPGYISPEQAINANNADARSDIYSLGCTLFFLLTGRHIYDEGSVLKTLMAHQNNPIPVLSEVRRDVNADLQALFEKMVAKRPEDRYQKVTELIADLRSLKNHSKPWNIGAQTEEVSEDTLADFIMSLNENSDLSSDQSSKEHYLDDSEMNISAANIFTNPLSTMNSHSSISVEARQLDTIGDKRHQIDLFSMMLGGSGILIIVLLVLLLMSF